MEGNEEAEKIHLGMHRMSGPSLKDSLDPDFALQTLQPSTLTSSKTFLREERLPSFPTRRKRLSLTQLPLYLVLGPSQFLSVTI